MLWQVDPLLCSEKFEPRELDGWVVLQILMVASCAERGLDAQAGVAGLYVGDSSWMSPVKRNGGWVSPPFQSESWVLGCLAGERMTHPRIPWGLA